MPDYVSIRPLSRARACWLLALLLASPVSADPPIRITIGEPSVWSLEQAHYLLNRMHATNDRLKAKELGDTDLDPNVTHGSRIEILRTLFSAAAEVNEPLRAQNRAALQNFQSNVNRREDLRQRLDQRRSQLSATVVRIGQLQLEKAALDADPGTSVATKQHKANELTAAQTEKTALEADIASLNEELKNIAITEPTLETPAPAVATSGPQLATPQDFFSTALEGVPGGIDNPRLHASTILDNYIQMQYEIIVKQLTLLRDEVGPDRRVIFLELPISLYSQPRWADDHLIQVRWRATDVCRGEELQNRLLRIRARRNALTRMNELLGHRNESEAKDKTLHEILVPSEFAELREIVLENDLAWLEGLIDQEHMDDFMKLLAKDRYAIAKSLESSTPANLKKLLQDKGLKLARDVEAALSMRFGGGPDENGTRKLKRLLDKNDLSISELFDFIERQEIAFDCKPSEPDCQTKAPTLADIRQACAGGSEWLKAEPPTQDQSTAKSRGDDVQEGIDADRVKFWTLFKYFQESRDLPMERIAEAVGPPIGDDRKLPLWFTDPSYTGQEDTCVDPARLSSMTEFPVRTLDLIPRQSALNVNEIYDTAKGLSFMLKSLWLGGGAAAQFQRQRQLFEQFLYQEAFATGFGKGGSEFGWTFGPLPGTRQIAPGVRTTFAVVVVPKDAAAIKLDAVACAFHRTWLPEKARISKENRREFVVPIPAAEEGFYLTHIDYTSVAPGRRVTVFLEAESFSPQTGVLVNGVPLRRAVAIARPGFISEEAVPAASLQGHHQVSGDYELVNSRKLILSFSMEDDYEGTPIISLVTPQKTTPINFFTVLVNRRLETSLANQSKVAPMFLRKLSVQGLRPILLTADEREVCKERPVEPSEQPAGANERSAGANEQSAGSNNGPAQSEETLYAATDLVGSGFRPGAEIWINEKKIDEKEIRHISTSHYRLPCFQPDNSSELTITLRQPTRQGLEEFRGNIPHPRAPRVISQELVKVTETEGLKKATLKLGIAGSNAGDLCFLELGAAEKGCLRSETLSSTELVLLDLRLPAADDPVVLKVTDDKSAISTLVSILPPEPPAITSIHGPDGTAKGVQTGNYEVTIRGRNLRNVTRVLFGTNQATIQSARSSELKVIAPASTTPTPVHIRLETDIFYLGRELDNSRDPDSVTSFAYTPPPKT